MKKSWMIFLLSAACALISTQGSLGRGARSVTVPFSLDHNRLVVEAEMKRSDGSWRKVRLWMDTGSPDFILSAGLARDLSLDVSAPDGRSSFEVKLGGMTLDFRDAGAAGTDVPSWLFGSIGVEANLPSTVLKHYEVVIDYPARTLTLAEPGSLVPRGIRVPAGFNRANGIVQVEAAIGAGKISLAVDIGASYSFIAGDTLDRLTQGHPDWPRYQGAAGCANMWGWWPPRESDWQVVRLPELSLGAASVVGPGLIGLPKDILGGLGAWYSQKTLRPVQGFLGPNVFKAFRLEIDYARGEVRLEKTGAFDSNDMDIVGIGLRQETDGGFAVTGIAAKNGKPAVESVRIGDALLAVGSLTTRGRTMGAVVDALRGKPGDTRVLRMRRGGQEFTVAAKVLRLL
jgi:hypothetical protein